MFCNNCGHRNPSGANFCSSCGAVLPTSAEETTVTFTPVDSAGEAVDEEISVGVPELAEGSAVLVITRGGNAGVRYALDRPLVQAGRHPESDIFLDDITVSRRHAEIIQRGSGHVLRDVGSLNGTYLNRVRIEEAPLAGGDEVQIGKFKLVYLAGAADA